MNDLWEEYFFRRLRASLPLGWHIQAQPRKVFWALEESRQEKRIKPDIVLTNPTGQNIVIDTKWKTPDGFVPSDNDLKQMFVYNEYWKAQHGILLYPLNELDGHFKGMMGSYPEPIQSDKFRSNCAIMKVDILKPEGEKKVLNSAFIVDHLIKYVESPGLMNKSPKEPATF
jgi:5-methylcytosine-specific restriction enzyme subunit McrC